MSDTPKSKEGRQKVTDMTKSGIDDYEDNKYSEAIKTFEEAIAIFPGHIGLNLNLVQCIVAEVKRSGVQFGYEGTCRKSLRRISGIAPDDAQYSRYLHLMTQVDELF
jgi:hypothetical protein